MELVQLRYFKAVAQYQNFTKAAEKLHITQSALSKAISRLEDEAGMQLFTRSGNKISLNTFGKLFLSRVEQSLTELDDGLREIRERSGLEKGNVSVAVSETVIFPKLIDDFLTLHKDVSMKIQLLSPGQMQEQLMSGNLDFAVSDENISNAEITWNPLYRDRMSVMLPSGHPLAGRDKIYLDELKNERFVIGNSSYGRESYTRKMCAEAGFSANVLLESYNYEMNGILSMKCMAVSLAPFSTTCAAQFANGYNNCIDPLVIVPLADEANPRTIGVAVKKGHYSSHAAQEFFSMVVDYYTQQLPPAWKE